MKVVFFIVQLQEFFLLGKTFSQIFLLANGLLHFGSWLANSMTQLNIPRLHLHINVRQDWYDHILSKLLSGTFSGRPLKTTLSHLPYWAKSLWFDSSMTTLFSCFSHFSFSLAFSSCKFLITMSFWLMILSFSY